MSRRRNMIFNTVKDMLNMDCSWQKKYLKEDIWNKNPFVFPYILR